MSMNRDNFRANQPPSKVLHVRNLPPDATEEEVQQLCRPFGRIIKVKMSGKEKTQAFVEFDNINQAINMVAYFVGNSNPPKVRNKAVYLQYSTRSEIGGGSGTGGMSAGLGVLGGMGSTAGAGGAPASTVLLVIMDNINVALGPTLDSLHLMFTTFGAVAKITIFEKAGGLQALVQMVDARAAREAKQQLDGRVMPPYLVPSHPGDIRLKVSYSEHSDINVRYQGPRSRDFTNAYLPHATGSEPGSTGATGPGATAGAVELAPSKVLLLMIDNVMYPVTVDALHTICSTYGQVLRMSVFEKGGHWQALVQFADVAAATAAKQCVEGHCMYEGGVNKLKASYSVHTELNVRSNTEFTRDFTAAELPTTSQPQEAQRPMQQQQQQPGAVHSAEGGIGPEQPGSGAGAGAAAPQPVGKAEAVAAAAAATSCAPQYLRGIDWEAAHEEAARQGTAAMSVPLVGSMQRPPARQMAPHAAVPPMWGAMPMRAPYGSGMPSAGFYGAPYG